MNNTKVNPFEELISAVEMISQCGGRCPNCLERILPYPRLEHVAS